MLRSLLVVMVLAATAGADVRTYDVHAVRRGSTDFPSCYATDRMMRDRHVIRIDLDGDSVTVNGLQWNPYAGVMPDLLMDFHRYSDGASQDTWLEMDLYVNEGGLYGKYTLFGERKGQDGQLIGCRDVVYVDGTRR